ncbi:MAG TPA: family 3 encapsulin nanocompartment shell protein [Actinophytocola sp.]|nr:family 3 encapsulin nanocompartment shell protein [Actinophytocola sp.]
MTTRTTATRPAEVGGERKSPGRILAEAVAADGLEASVELDETITGSLKSFRRKPRYPARNLLRVVDLSRQDRRYYWHESAPHPDDPQVDGAAMLREAASRFHSSPVPELLATTAWVQVPPDLWTDTDAFQSFVDSRLVARLGTAENATIIRGDGGLLSAPGIARLTSPGPFSSTLLRACDEVEQMGATADGMIINPADYYAFMSKGSLMADLDQNGVLIVRTRLVDPGTAIIGDFGHGAQLFDAGRSVMRFGQPPPGTFAEPGVALMAQIHERVVVNLPANFFVVSLHG